MYTRIIGIHYSCILYKFTENIKYVEYKYCNKTKSKNHNVGLTFKQ